MPIQQTAIKFSDILSSAEIFKVPQRCALELWPVVVPWLEKAISYAPPWWTQEGIRRRVLSGEYALWIALVDAEPRGMVLTEIIRHDRAIVGAAPWIGGVNMRQWFPQMQAEVEKWAKACGATYFMGNGRKGWVRTAHMRDIGAILIKEL